MDLLKDEILFLFFEGIKAASPEVLFSDYLREQNLIVTKLRDQSKKQYVFALGKAAYSMAIAFQRHFPVNGGYILTKYGYLPEGKLEQKEDSIWKYREASHPIPDENSIICANEVVTHLKQLGKETRLIVLLSGGGSSLFEIPKDGYSINDLIQIQEQLLNSGKPIQVINEERKKYSEVKGGKLLKNLNPDLEVFTYVISDVLGDDPNSIASAPTYPSNNYFIIGNITRSLKKIITLAKEKGFETKLLSDSWGGTTEETAILFEKEFLSALDSPKKQLILLGGEMVCPVYGNGIGGRNQETALRISLLFQQHKTNRKWMFLSGGTDGTDGPTDATGGIVSNESFSLMEEKGWNPRKELFNSNSYPLLKDVNGLVFTGPTGTNVNDIVLLLFEAS
ncbi:glycerate kinase [Leptospira sp. WS39.C2]